MRLLGVVCAALGAFLLVVPGALAAPAATEGPAPAAGVAVLAYESERDLRAALARHPALVIRRIPSIGVAEVRPAGTFERFTAAVRRLPGITFAGRPQPRVSAAEPALQAGPFRAGPYRAFAWQWYATRSHAVPEWVLRAASAITIAVVDTGADLAAPDLAAKGPVTLDLVTGSADVTDEHGHGTFVAALAAGSVTNGEGIAGAGGDARLLVVRAGSGGRLTDIDEARAIVEAVDRGARIVNLSFGGPRTSPTERRAIDYAVSRGVLLVAAVGNDHQNGNPVEYPAALLQPKGSRGVGGAGLAVAASAADGTHAWFSNTGTHVSLAAPGDEVFSAVSSLSSPAAYPRVPLPGSAAGLYGFGTGTSYAAPQVAGAAALVWGANPTLTASQVAQVLKETAQGGGRWTPGLGYGVVDAAAAVARAVGKPAAAAAPPAPRLELSASKTKGRHRLRVALTARLEAAGTPDAREVVLEIRVDGAWRQAARATTDAAGRAVWRVSLGPGSHKLRARHTTPDGSAELTSGLVSIAVRGT